MSIESVAPLAPGAVIGSRFRLDESLKVPGREAFIATDQESEARVVVTVVSEAHAKLLEPARALEHAHLAPVLALAVDAGRTLVVAADVPGETLDERLKAVGHKEPVDAVRSALRVADAIHALHDAGGVHGLVNARSVVVSPEDREAPVLAFLPTTDDDSFFTPEHAEGDAPAAADDAWAIASLLHIMLTGKPPPRAGYEPGAELVGQHVPEPSLRRVLQHALQKSPEGRADLHDLRRELARWFVEHAGEEPIAPGPHSRHPPPLPHSVPAHTGAGTSQPPGVSKPAARSRRAPTRKRRVALFVGLALLLGLVGGGVVTMLRPDPVKVVEVPAAEPEPTNSAIDLGEVPVTASSAVATEKSLGNKLAVCVAGYLPQGSFSKAPALDWLCSETDPRNGGDKLRAAVVVGAGKQSPTEAMKIFSRLGWYEMAAFAVVRAGCCSDTKPLAMPDAHADCGMSEKLGALGEAVIGQRGVEAALKGYTDSIHCELNRGGEKVMRRSERPQGGQDTAFMELVSRLE